MNPVTTPMSSAQAEQLLRLWVRNQADVYRYVYAVLPNAVEAQEVLQATCVALWRKAADLDLERPFLPLAFRFAILEVRKHRERNQRWQTFLRDDALETVAELREEIAPLLEVRRQALAGCLAALPAKDRDLIDRHYYRQATVPEIAAATGQNIHTLYKALQRIRRQLLRCIAGQLAAEEM